MNCINCYHYQSCASVDVTGYVVDREKAPEETCEYFITLEDIRPKAHWVRKVRPFRASNDVCVCYECSRCGAESERVYTKDFIQTQLWDEYQKDHWMPKNELCPFCQGCGAEMELDKTNHTNNLSL